MRNSALDKSGFQTSTVSHTLHDAFYDKSDLNFVFLKICDVCDDREQLVALFEEQPRSGLPGDHLGDGMSSEDSSDSKDHQANTNGLISSASSNGLSAYDNNLLTNMVRQF